MFDIHAAYAALMNSQPQLASGFHLWRATVPRSITYLFSNVSGEHVYVGTCCKRNNGHTDDRLMNHIVRKDRLSNFGTTYKKISGSSDRETRALIGTLQVRWFEGSPADCKRVEHLVITLNAPMCSDAGIYYQPSDRSEAI